MKLISTLAVIPVLFAAAPALAAPQHNLVVTVTPPAAPQVNTFGHYVARVTNTGNKNATAVTLSIALPRTHTSPQVFVMGNLANVDGRCALSATTLNCQLNGIARFGGYTDVHFDLKLPYSSAPLNFTYTANPITGDANPANNTLATTVAPATLFPSSIAGFAADYAIAGQTISIPGEPTFGGTWSQTGGSDRLQVTFTDGGTPVGSIDARGVGGGCFEGPMTFSPPSPYLAIYRICP